MISLSQRDLQPELMDVLELDEAEHHYALDGLRRLNRVSRVSNQLCLEMLVYARARKLKSLRVLDIASGGGDVQLGLWKLAKRQGLELQILGLDVSAAACAYATERCRGAAGSIVFNQCDVTRESLPTDFDAVTCSLFLHHLTVEQA